MTGAKIEVENESDRPKRIPSLQRPYKESKSNKQKQQAEHFWCLGGKAILKRKIQNVI